MLRLSSSTSVFPSATAQGSTQANESNKRTLQSSSVQHFVVFIPVRFSDNKEPNRSACLTGVDAAILLRKSTSALAEVALTLTPKSSQSQEGTRRPDSHPTNDMKPVLFICNMEMHLKLQNYKYVLSYNFMKMLIIHFRPKISSKRVKYRQYFAFVY